MSGFSHRFKRLFRTSKRKGTANPDSSNEEPTSPGFNPRYPRIRDINRNGIDDELENITNNARSQPPTLPGQARGRRPSDESARSSPINLSNSRSRPAPNGIRPGVTPNNNTLNPPTMNTDTVSFTNPSSRVGLPGQEPNSDQPADSAPQLPLPPVTPFPQSSLRERFPLLVNRNQYPIRRSPNSSLVDFPMNQTRRLAWPGRSSFTPRPNQSSHPTHLFPSRTQPRLSNIQIDYPINNVVIDENIPSSIAFKINDAVEYDRFGNIYHTQHYAYEPKTQHISIGNNQQMERRLVGNSSHTGMRFIREINNENYYPQKQTSNNNIQLIIDNTPQITYSCQYNLNSFSAPINHFIAHASVNDPMRCY